MPRDQAGRVAETIKMPAASKVAPDTSPQAATHCPHCAEHHDRLVALEKHAGITHKADAYKDEDQGGKAKIGVGHVTEKGGNMESGRKRH